MTALNSLEQPLFLDFGFIVVVKNIFADLLHMFLGHVNPRVSKAAADQCMTLVHSQVGFFFCCFLFCCFILGSAASRCMNLMSDLLRGYCPSCPIHPWIPFSSGTRGLRR